MSDDKPSKSEKKREHAALQSLGESLIGLDASVLAHLPIDDAAREAIVAAKSMNSRGALRRQKKLIGKRLVGTDVAAVEGALDELNRDTAARKRVFAAAERWRDRILDQGETAIDDCAGSVDDEVCEALRKTFREWQTAVSDRDDKRLRRTLFRQLHDALMTHPQDVRLPR